MSEAEAIRWAVTAFNFIVGFVTQLGYRDAVLVALDTSLGALRARNDRDLDAKHAPRPTPAQHAIVLGLIARGPLQHQEREAVQALVEYSARA